MLSGVEPEESLALAALSCEVGDDGRPPRSAPGLHLVVLAAGLARTPDVPLSPDPVPVEVGERQAR
jgi:hypothetical protein